MPDWMCGLTAVTEPGKWAVLLSAGHGLYTAVKALLQADLTQSLPWFH